MYQKLKVGDRVKRGPDWRWKKQDYNNGSQGEGIVTEIRSSTYSIKVEWDGGYLDNYEHNEKTIGLLLVSSDTIRNSPFKTFKFN